MKCLFSLFIFLSGSACIHAQVSNYTKSAVISSLNLKAEEANGNIRFFLNSKEKIIIDGASFTATETGVKITVVLVSTGNSRTTFTSEFNPANITRITESDMPKESPVGQMQIILDNQIGHRTSYHKKDGVDQSYEDAMTFNFLKVDKDNFKQIQALLFRLQELYADESGQPLLPLKKVMSTNKDFWISGMGFSNTYQLSNVYVTGCTMRVMYYLQSIGTSGDVKQWFMSIIPLSDIEDVHLDKGKSKPNCIMLESGKKGFETFAYKGKKYIPANAVKEIPLFIDVTSESRRDDVMVELKKRVRECGGGKIKL